MQKVVKEIMITFIIGTLVFIIGTVFFEDFKQVSTKQYLITFGFYQLYAFVLGYGNAAYFGFLEKRKWKDNEGPKRIIIGVLGSIALTILGLFLLRIFTSVVYYGNTFSYFIENERLENYRFGFWITMIIVAIFHFIYFYNRYQKRKIKEQKVIAGTASAKFDALKNQLDPHFLFNSLNVLTSLIDENPNNAQKFTTSLSKIYRYVLEQKNKDLITVDEELEFAKTYMSLLKMRFEDSIVFEIPDRALNPEAKVVPLSLQLLLENAVKHNVVTSSKPLFIKIYEENDSLVVENNLQIKQIIKKSSGVGLNNIKQRYKLLTKKRILISETKTHFRVAVPILTKQISVMESLPQTQLDNAYIKARKYVDSLREFYYHVITYSIGIPFLAFINYMTYWRIKWFLFSMICWGIGLGFHALNVYGKGRIFGGKQWEDKKIREFMEQERKNY